MKVFLFLPLLACSFVYLNSGFLHCDLSTFCFLLLLGLLLLKALCVHSCASSHIISVLLFALMIHYGFPMKIILMPCTVEACHLQDFE